MMNIKLLKAKLLIEAAEAIKYNQTLNEGLGAIMIGATIMIPVFGLVTVACQQHKSKKETKKMYGKMTNINNYELYDIQSKIKNAKHVTYLKPVKDILTNNYKIVSSILHEVEILDNALSSYKSIDEYNIKKDKVQHQYKKLYTVMMTKLDTLNSKLQLKNNEWIDDDFSILNILEKYISLINDFHRNLDPDDFWEGIEFTKDLDDNEFNTILRDMYKVYSSFPIRDVDDIKEYMEPLKYIKIQFYDK